MTNWYSYDLYFLTQWMKNGISIICKVQYIVPSFLKRQLREPVNMNIILDEWYSAERHHIYRNKL